VNVYETAAMGARSGRRGASFGVYPRHTEQPSGATRAPAFEDNRRPARPRSTEAEDRAARLQLIQLRIWADDLKARRSVRG
jgi:hypothetical protein